MKNIDALMKLSRKILLFVTIISLALIYSCQEDGLIPTINNQITAEYLQNRADLQIYLNHEQVFRIKGKPGITPIQIGSNNLSEYETCFILYIASGAGSEGTVSSAIIKLDGQEVLNASDFSNSSKQYEFEVCNLSTHSQIEVEVRGTPGSFVDIWMEGKKKVLTVTDVDGNIYQTIKIGDQWWMAENLRSTHYQNGDPVPTTPRDVDMSNEFEPRYQWPYNADENFLIPYGRYYTWYVYMDDRNICPTGWHAALEEDWGVLLGNIESIGDLKSTGTIAAGDGPWYGPNVCATNKTGFNMLPTGAVVAGHGWDMGWSAAFWVATWEGPYIQARGFSSYSCFTTLGGYPPPAFGLPIRCVKYKLPPTSDLLAYYPFNGNINDESGNELNLTSFGSPTLTTDRHGTANSAYGFNGTTDYFYHESSILLKPSSNFTINMWFYNSGVDGNQDVLISTLSDLPSLTSGYQLGMGNMGSIGFVYSGTKNGTLGSGVEALYESKYMNKWTMVTAIYTSTELKLYLDGKLIATHIHDGQITYDGANNFAIGTNLDILNAERMFKGLIDDVRLYNRALTQTEILELYYE